MQFRQLFDRASCTYTYLLADGGQAVLIDPVKELVDRDVQLIEELGLTLVATLETHVHADHVTAASLLKQRLGSQAMCASSAGVPTVDRALDDGDMVRFGSRALHVRHTPGHTGGCATYVLDDASMAFTGDALLIRGCGRTDFQQGDARQLYSSVRERIFSLPSTTKLFPGHDYKGRTVTTVAEEREHNPRVGDARTVDQFVEIMDNLGLAYPKHIHRAVPANLALGVEAVDHWGELHRAECGATQVDLPWLRRYAMRVVDVREPEEWASLPPLDGAESISLGGLVEAAASWDRSQPIVLVCRSGKRSDRGALLLEAEGFSHVASLTGGMLAVGGA